MKRWILIVIGLAMAALGCAALWCKYTHRVVQSELSEVYLRYKDRDDLRVAFVKDYRVDDSTVVDVTTLTARDSASWENLLREMNFMEEVIEQLRESYKKGEQLVGKYYCIEDQPEQHIYRPIKEYSEFDCVVYVQLLEKSDRTIFVFDIASAEEGGIVGNKKMNEIIERHNNFYFTINEH